MSLLSALEWFEKNCISLSEHLLGVLKTKTHILRVIRFSEHRRLKYTYCSHINKNGSANYRFQMIIKYTVQSFIYYLIPLKVKSLS